MTATEPAQRPVSFLPLQIDSVGTLRTALGECPVWDGATQSLWLVDSRLGQVWRIDVRTAAQVCFELPPPIGSFALNHDGQLVVAMKEEVVLFDPATGSLRSLGRIGDQHPHLRLNDGAAMPDGSFVVGTMHTFRAPGEAPLGGLYRVDTQGQMHRLDQGLGVVNGPVAHPASGDLHVCDSEARRIHVYPPLGTQPWPRRVFADTRELGSAPDGCCFDTEGGLWTALVHTGHLARFDGRGRLTHHLKLPLAHPSSLCFGGPDLADLFVTSISDSGRLKADGPRDGQVLRVGGLGFRGAPRPRCHIVADA